MKTINYDELALVMPTHKWPEVDGSAGNGPVGEGAEVDLIEMPTLYHRPLKQIYPDDTQEFFLRDGPQCGVLKLKLGYIIRRSVADATEMRPCGRC